MDIVIDTCIYLRNDPDQSKVKGFEYKNLEIILENNVNNVYLTPFSVSEIFAKRNYNKIDDLIDDIKSRNIKILEYVIPELTFFSVDIINKYFEIIYYHLTDFLNFFIIQIIMNYVNDDYISIFTVIKNELEKYYTENGIIDFYNITYFMKNKCVDCIVSTITNTLKHYGVDFDGENAIWKKIGDSNINPFLFDNVDADYINYSKYLINLFKNKFNNNANKIELKFGFIDLMVAHANKNKYVVISRDKDIAKYLLKHGTSENKYVIKELWCESIYKKLTLSKDF